VLGLPQKDDSKALLQKCFKTYEGVIFLPKLISKGVTALQDITDYYE
jgi:hypothetical protein